MVTHNKELLMAFVYFDQSHCGYLLERDLEEILYTLGLHLSRAQVSAETSADCFWICASLARFTNELSHCSLRVSRLRSC